MKQHFAQVVELALQDNSNFDEKRNAVHKKFSRYDILRGIPKGRYLDRPMSKGRPGLWPCSLAQRFSENISFKHSAIFFNIRNETRYANWRPDSPALSPCV